MPTETFPCPACGASVEPVSNQNIMPCPYCNYGLTIPVGLRWKQAVETPPVKMPKFDPFSVANQVVTPEMRAKKIEAAQKTSHLLRKAAPLATNAYRTYAWWSMLAFFAPTCLTVLGSICVISVIVWGVLIFLAQRAH